MGRWGDPRKGGNYHENCTRIVRFKYGFYIFHYRILYYYQGGRWGKGIPFPTRVLRHGVSRGRARSIILFASAAGVGTPSHPFHGPRMVGGVRREVSIRYRTLYPTQLHCPSVDESYTVSSQEAPSALNDRHFTAADERRVCLLYAYYYYRGKCTDKPSFTRGKYKYNV